MIFVADMHSILTSSIMHQFAKIQVYDVRFHHMCAAQTKAVQKQLAFPDPNHSLGTGRVGFQNISTDTPTALQYYPLSVLHVDSGKHLTSTGLWLG